MNVLAQFCMGCNSTFESISPSCPTCGFSEHVTRARTPMRRACCTACSIQFTLPEGGAPRCPACGTAFVEFTPTSVATV